MSVLLFPKHVKLAFNIIEAFTNLLANVECAVFEQTESTQICCVISGDDGGVIYIIVMNSCFTGVSLQRFSKISKQWSLCVYD